MFLIFLCLRYTKRGCLWDQQAFPLYSLLQQDYKITKKKKKKCVFIDYLIIFFVIIVSFLCYILWA